MGFLPVFFCYPPGPVRRGPASKLFPAGPQNPHRWILEKPPLLGHRGRDARRKLTGRSGQPPFPLATPFSAPCLSGALRRWPTISLSPEQRHNGGGDAARCPRLDGGDPLCSRHPALVRASPPPPEEQDQDPPIPGRPAPCQLRPTEPSPPPAFPSSLQSAWVPNED